MSKIVKIKLDDITDQQAMQLVGDLDRNLKMLSDLYGIEISYRLDELILIDASEQQETEIRKIVEVLLETIKKNIKITQRDVIYACRLVQKGFDFHFDHLFTKIIGKTITGKSISPKTLGQYEFISMMETKDIVFAIGPAGTGKTYLAVTYAVSLLKKGEVKRIVLTRPAVEAGESLGFLPGDLKEKVDPYLRPLYDALHDMLGMEVVEKYIEKGIIEIAPLAYMRGRTLEDSFVILDEAQNTTPTQMKMFLTRLGFNSKMVINGDITQIDLGKESMSGLLSVDRILKDIHEIGILKLTSDDVVRHPLVQKIIESYAKEKR